MENPILSIITINYNNVKGLARTFDSVFSQTFKQFEYIVVDGGSTDGSKDLLVAKNRNIDYWISEKDKGIYHAMNKGITNAKGNYLLFINSGDELSNNDILAQLFNAPITSDILYGDLIFVKNNEERIVHYPKSITFKFLFQYSLPHPSCIIRKECFNKVGYYNEKFKIVSDWKFFIDALVKFDCSFEHRCLPISKFHEDGISSINENIALEERKAILSTYYAPFLKDYQELNRLERFENRVSYLNPLKLIKRFFK